MTAPNEFTFAASLDRIPASRRWVVDRARSSGYHEPSLRTIALLTTEAVTNAIRHGPERGEVTVTTSEAGGEWRVAVTDESAQMPVRCDPLPLAAGGRGVMLIDRLASSWGVERRRNGKTVWFRVS